VTSEHPVQPITITLEARSVLSYAMAHNEIPVISRLAIENVPTDVQAARLRLEVADATGSIGEPQEILFDLQAGRPTVLTDIKLLLEPAAMLQVEEQRPAAIRARLDIDGTVRAEQVFRTRVLAAHQWLATPPALALEMLAAHVMPNHPAVTALMRDVAQRLQASTGSPSLEGYQSGPERVEQVVGAVYAAMQACGIRYAEPAASWADNGQKVRTPGEVLDDRVGTCLDTVVVMAAALEQAGVRPLIWVVDGHAFLGYWREATSLGTVAEFDTGGVVNRIDLGQIGLVETTALTLRPDAVPFAEAQRTPYAAHLTGDLENVIGVVDVHQARVDHIIPLPARTRGDDGQVIVTQYVPPAVSAPGYAPDPRSGRVVPGRISEPRRITNWKNALLDLSLRNRLINFTPRSALSLAVPEGRLGLVEDLLNRDSSIILRPADDLAAIDRERGVRHGRDLPQAQLVDLLEGKRTVHVDVTDAAYASRMRSLAYKARTIVEETGANNLYLAIGSLVWDLDGRTLRSPLILVPVVLKAASRGGRYRISIDEAGSSTPNYCLVEKLRQVHGLDIPGLADPVADDSGIDVEATFEATRRAIAARGLRFRVEPTADLAVLQFAKFRLWKDLDENWATFEENPLVAHLIRTPTDAFVDPMSAPVSHDLDGLDERCPVPADASQLRAIAEATAGRTFVLEGPPGTGKSQTITNLLTHAVAEGKRVLFVAEKRAALDVVQKRLNAVGMGPLSLDLHDKGSKPAAVREQIKQALEHAVVADTQDHAIKIEELRSARRGLTRYAYRLHERNGAGLALYEARGAELAIGDDVTPMPVPESLMTGGNPDTVERLRQLFSTLPDRADAARPRPEHPWAFIDSAAGIDATAVLVAARRFDVAVPALPGVLGPALAAVRVPADLAVLAELVDAAIPLQVLDASRSRQWTDAVGAIVNEVAQFASAPHPGLDVVMPEVLDLPIGEIDAEAKSSFFGRRKRLVAVRDRLVPVLRPGAAIKPKRLTELTGMLVDLEKAVLALAAKICAIPGLVLPPGWSPFTEEGRHVLEARIDRVRRAGHMVAPSQSDPEQARFVPALRAVLDSGVQADPRPVHEAATAAKVLLQVCCSTASAVAKWAGTPGLLGRWRLTVAERGLADPQLGSLRRWLDLLAHLEPLRAEHLGEARAAVLAGSLDPDDARRSFELGLARASIAERLRTTGLESFDAGAHERSIARFVTSSRAVRNHLATVVPQQVLSARGFNPRAAGGKVGQLQRQLTAKRGGMNVRELMTSFGDVITRALPCVLVSPDSLSRFFPAAAGLFEIVVFDEASQVRVADAIGAMGRARSVVIVGDSKQMPPTSFAESSFGSDDLDAENSTDVVEDEESILTECVQARVERHRLSWHYRSQDESLIAFSNHHYYDGGLSSFPAPATSGTGVSLVRVDGQFHRSGPRATLRTNPVEAEAVVAEVSRRFTASPDAPPSLGVVTFNQQQRTFIEGLLRDVGDQRLIDALEDPDGLFVKNLENVQGDERDVILFSTAFSVNDKGVLPLNFGPLNRAGGERRLNVAVSRARRQVIVYSSFDPGQLRTEETSSVGLRHLRTYLEMAANGPSVLPRSAQRSTVADRHREEIASRLRERGLEVRTNVGLSEFAIDLVLGDPDDPRVAVLLDGRPWSKRLTVRDRDALPREVLTDVLRWPAVERVWLPTWLADPDAVVERLVAAAAAASRPAAPIIEIQPPMVAPPVETPQARTVEVPARVAETPVVSLIASAPTVAPPIVDVAWPNAVEVFVPWAVRHLGHVDVLDALPTRSAASAVSAALAEVVAAEGPIHTDRLARLVANGFGLNRVAESRKSAILRHLPRGLRQDSVESVVWSAARVPEEWVGFRSTPEGVDRPLEHVPLREIVNAMVPATRAAAGMPREELHREVLAVFGWRRRTRGATERLDAALELGVRSNRLRFDGAVVMPC
jgi:SpoU rRNA methylase family enzyme